MRTSARELKTRPEETAGRIGRRRQLPTGRAVVGAFAVAAAGVLFFAAFIRTQGHVGRAWVVATTGMPAGTRLSAADLTTSTLSLGSDGAAGDAFGTPADVVGRTLAVAVGRGDLVLSAELTTPGATPALRRVPVTVAPDDLVDLTDGDLVDILETTGDTAAAKTAIVVRGARVIDANQPSSSFVGSNGDAVVTLGVHTLREVEAVIDAEHDGTVDLVVGEPSDGTGPGA
jgi:hypothetical protein